MLIKVLIVDDEERQRSTIVKYVNWEAYRMHVIGEAETGQEALALAADNPPDLLITDIRMMGMNGLELSASMQKINKKLRVVMITGYEEFEYAKAAVELGVEAFLVKPVNFEELGEVLEQISLTFFEGLKKQEEEAQLHEQLKELMPIAREKLLQELINGLAKDDASIRQRAQYLHMFESGDTYIVIVITMDSDAVSVHTGEEALHLVQLKVRTIALNVIDSLFLEATTSSRGDTVLIVKGTSSIEAQDDLVQKLDFLRTELEKEIGCVFSIGIGLEVDTLRRIAESFRLASRAVNQRLLLGSGQIIHWRDIGEKNEYHGMEFVDLFRDFLEALRIGERNNLKKTLEEIVRGLIGSTSITEAEMRSTCLELISGAIRIIGEMGESLTRRFESEQELWKQIINCNGSLQILQVTLNILNEFCDFISERKMSRHRAIVQQSLEYIGEHFSEDLSLQNVAEKVYLSSSYLGAVIRTELGQSFTDYLTGIRINKAKELLKDPQLKIYEVAERVGYQNSTYFCNLFKRLTGFSPKEYCNSLGGIEKEL